MNPEIETVITGYISGQIQADQVTREFIIHLDREPEAAGNIRDHLKTLFTSGKINIDRYKFLSETLTKVYSDTTLSMVNRGQLSELELEDRTQFLGGLGIEVEETAVSSSTPDNGSDEEAPITVIAAKKVRSTTLLDPNTGAKTESTPDTIGPGTELKGRFILIERLGEGGMGVVYKAKDRLKAEAQDHNPYVAIKVLTEAFKKYSGSYIALQREASKAQRLAHPNIATVYDFDRDGDTVFMTMELLQGTPLNTYIKQLPEGGLSEDAGLKLIKEMGDGLAYAHKHNLVHSDFKPGNCFLQINGIVKVLDFGIARASGTKNLEEGGEETIFDPSKLGALTPAYASIEMFEGQDPDVRDDIYGFACVCYELLTGKHPFNKVAASKAQGLDLKPKPIKGLSRKQNKAFARALAFEREERTETVEQFLDELTRKKSYVVRILTATSVTLLIVAAMLYKPYMDYKIEQDTIGLIDAIKQGDNQALINLIWTIDQVPTDLRNTYTLHLREQIINYYASRIDKVVDEPKGRYDYPQAIDLIKRAQIFYPDSASLNSQKKTLLKARRHLLNRMSALYNRYLEQDELLKTASGKDLTRVIPIIRRADPENPLLTDPRLIKAYTQAAESAIANGDIKRAVELMKTSFKFTPENDELMELQNKLNLPPAEISG
ncbi:MAG: serine/threonine protein kinase [Gammaproteobacteria bacterium]|nr:serine/threonine protein kinase [Gammaproteobacteria bacterium]